MRSDRRATGGADAGARIPDWGLGPPPSRRSTPLVSAAVASLLVAGVAYLGRIELLLVAAGVASIALALWAWWWSRRSARLLAREGARPLDPQEHPRVANIVAGIAARLGIEPPKVSISSDGEPNAAAVSVRGGDVLLFRSSLVDSYTRTEVEAVVAFLLVASISGATRRKPSAHLLAHLDVSAAALTRYPPALAAALAKAVPAEGAGALWLVGSGYGIGPEERRRALLDL